MTQTIAWHLQHVTAQLGEAEQPLGSNHTHYGAQFGENDCAWCAIFGCDMYDDAGVPLPVRSASCVAMYDGSLTRGLVVNSASCVPGDAVVRTWQHLSRAQLNPALTHFQLVVGTHLQGGVKILELIGGNQGPGIVSRDWVTAGDASVLGGLAFSRLFTHPSAPPVHPQPGPLPAPKSHKYPKAFLSLGSHGALVVALQHKLQSHGLYQGNVVDGSFGPKTLAAVIEFQKRTWPNDAHQWDGVVGPATFHAIGF